MSHRVTRQNVYAVFIHLCNQLGKRCYVHPDDLKRFRKADKYFTEPTHLAERYLEVGSWSLSETYGFSIQQMENENGGISLPFGSMGFTRKEFWEHIHFLRTALRYIEMEKGR